MYKLYDYFCAPCDRIFERLVLPKDADTQKCAQCGENAERMFPCPTVHTIETHLRGTDINVSHGGYIDHNLRDLKTGKYPHITSLAQKRRLLKEKGFYEYGSSDDRRKESDRLSKRKSVSG